jgi:hypothetical protein
MINSDDGKKNQASLINDSSYCKKVDEEYEAIKNTILNRNNKNQRKNETSSRSSLLNEEDPLSSSYYDNLDSLAKYDDNDDEDKIIVYEINNKEFEKANHEDEEDTLNDSQLDDIIKHVNDAEELTKQLDEIDNKEQQTDYEIINLDNNTSNFSFKSDNLTVLSDDCNDVNLKDSTIGTSFLSFVSYLI